MKGEVYTRSKNGEYRTLFGDSHGKNASKHPACLGICHRFNSSQLPCSKRILRLVPVSAQNVYRASNRSILARPRLPPLLLRSWSRLFCKLGVSSIDPGYLICYGNEGNMPDEDVMRSIKLIGKEVIPALHEVKLRPYE